MTSSLQQQPARLSHTAASDARGDGRREQGRAGTKQAGSDLLGECSVLSPWPGTDFSPTGTHAEVKFQLSTDCPTLLGRTLVSQRQETGVLHKSEFTTVGHGSIRRLSGLSRNSQSSSFTDVRHFPQSLTVFSTARQRWAASAGQHTAHVRGAARRGDWGRPAPHLAPRRAARSGGVSDGTAGSSGGARDSGGGSNGGGRGNHKGGGGSKRRPRWGG